MFQKIYLASSLLYMAILILVFLDENEEAGGILLISTIAFVILTIICRGISIKENGLKWNLADIILIITIVLIVVFIL